MMRADWQSRAAAPAPFDALQQSAVVSVPDFPRALLAAVRRLDARAPFVAPFVAQAEKYECPAGSWCPVGSVDPIECGLLDTCWYSGLSKKNSNAWLMVPLVLSPFVAMCVVQRSFHVRDRRREEREAQRKSLRKSSGGDSKDVELTIETRRNPMLVPLLGATATSSDGDEQGDVLCARRFRVDFEFRDLGLKIKGSGKSVLAGVTGKIKSAHITAVMGPSGAGKSTFMTTLAGKAYYGDTQGVVLINGVERQLADFKRVVGFVPQVGSCPASGCRPGRCDGMVPMMCRRSISCRACAVGRSGRLCGALFSRPPCCLTRGL